MSPSAGRRASLLQGAFWTAAGLWAMGWVWWSEHVAGMAPCELCFWERWPYRVLILLGLLWLALSGAGRPVARALGVLVTVALLAAIAIAGLHVGVEQGWWRSPLPACAAPHFVGGTLEQRLAAMPLRPAKPCDAPNRLFGWLPVSMAMLDLIYAALLLLAGRLLLPRLLETRRRP